MFSVDFLRGNGTGYTSKVFYSLEGLNKGIVKIIEDDKHNEIAGWNAQHNRDAVVQVLFKEKPEELNLSKMSPDDVLAHENGFVQVFGNMEQLERSYQSLSNREEGPNRIHQVVIIAPESNPKLLGKNITEVREVFSDVKAPNNITKN